jgi:hypothetical protein
MDISSILEKSKEFEYLMTVRDPQFSGMVTATEIVKKFIIDRGLIVYGGTAIDYALRLKGDNIYPDDMLQVPDLDFYSANNVADAYDLADLLYHAGFKDARAINALHMETMKVDIVDNHWMADITYRPARIFELLPYLEYNGMRIIHPDFQRIDIHSSLSFPYDNVPREVIFERWSKDIKRFNKLAAHYPIVMPKKASATAPLTIRISRKYVLGGFAAYAAVFAEYSREMKAVGGTVPPTVLGGGWSIAESAITFNTLDRRFEIIHFDPAKAAEDLKLTSVKHYEPYAGMLPDRTEGVNEDGTLITIYSTHHRLVSVNTVNGEGVRVANIQYLMKHFLSLYFVHRADAARGGAYLAHYVSLALMISSYEAALARLTKKSVEERVEMAAASIVFPSVITYGNENVNLARTIALNRLGHILDDAPLYKIPMNYYPGRSLERGVGHPAFDPAEVVFFQEEGREITAVSAVSN